MLCLLHPGDKTDASSISILELFTNREDGA